MSDSLIRQLRQWAETEEAFGITGLARRDAAPPLVSAPSLEEKRRRLAELEARYRACVLCPLSRGRTHVVFGSGNPGARLMFVGEAPGFEEDQQGKPFVGAAGQLLTNILKAMHLTREEVYIANCLKCRPPNNRNPLPTEIASCAPILEEQIRIIEPKIICALGKFAAQTLLASDETISRLRGRFFDRRGIRVMPTFHPAYLLRNPADKKLVWQDMQLILREL